MATICKKELEFKYNNQNVYYGGYSEPVTTPSLACKDDNNNTVYIPLSESNGQSDGNVHLFVRNNNKVYKTIKRVNAFGMVIQLIQLSGGLFSFNWGELQSSFDFLEDLNVTFRITYESESKTKIVVLQAHHFTTTELQDVLLINGSSQSTVKFYIDITSSLFTYTENRIVNMWELPTVGVMKVYPFQFTCTM